MAFLYQITERAADHRYDLNPVVHDTTPPVLGPPVGTYDTGAAAFDHIPASPPVTASEVIYLPLGNGNASFDDSIFDLLSLPPAPDGVTLPEISHDEFVRVFKGGYNGVQLIYTITPLVDIPEGDYAFTVTGDSQSTFSLPREYKTKCGQRNCTKTNPLASGVPSVDSTSTQNGDPTTARPETSTSNDSTPPPTTQPYQLCDGSINLTFGCYRSAGNERKIRLYLLGSGASDQADITLYVYAPVDGADFHSFYGIPTLAIDPSTGNPVGPLSGNSVTEITASATIFGVTLAVWGYAEYGDGYSFDPVIALEEL